MKKKFIFSLLVVMFAIIASSMAQSVEPLGHSTIYTGNSYDYSILFSGGDLSDYEVIQWGMNTGTTFSYTERSCGWGCYELSPTTTGVGTIWVQISTPANAIVGFLEVTVIEDPDPPDPPIYHPSAPSISGPSTADTYSTEEYSMPSSKDDYTWTISYQSYFMDEFENESTVFFNSGGLTIIGGRYKEDGLWSHWGWKYVTAD